MISRRHLIQSAAALPFALGSARIATAQREIAPLLNLMSFLPPIDESTATQEEELFSYVDIRALLDASGLDRFPTEFSGETEFLDRSMMVPLDTVLAVNATADWTSLIGFSLGDVDQMITGFNGGNLIRAYLGSFDPRAISAALAESDYVETSRDGFALFASPNGDAIDLASPIDRISPGAFNHLAVTERIIVTSMKQAGPRRITGVICGDSLASTFGGGPLSSLLVPMSGCYLFSGSVISAERLGTDMAAGAESLPAAQFFAAGITLGQDENLVEFLIDFGEDYVDTIPAIIEERIATGESIISAGPLADVLGPVDVAHVDDTGIVRISGTSDELAVRWQRVVRSLDLGFIATE